MTWAGPCAIQGGPSPGHGLPAERRQFDPPRQDIRTTALGIVLGAAVLAMSALGPLGGIVAMAVVGLAVPFANGPIQTILQVTIPPEMQGRVFSLDGSLAGAMTPVGLLLAAPVGDLAGTAAWYVAGGALCLTVGVAILVRPDLSISSAPA